MSTNPERVEEDFGSPSALALGELRTRVEGDPDLIEKFKLAFVADLDSETPAELLNLKAALSTEGAESAA